jgi:hypothetical protein
VRKPSTRTIRKRRPNGSSSPGERLSAGRVMVRVSGTTWTRCRTPGFFRPRRIGNDDHNAPDPAAYPRRHF